MKGSKRLQLGRFNYQSFNGSEFTLMVTSKQMSFNFLRGLSASQAKLANSCFQRLLVMTKENPEELNSVLEFLEKNYG